MTKARERKLNPYDMILAAKKAGAVNTRNVLHDGRGNFYFDSFAWTGRR